MQPTPPAPNWQGLLTDIGARLLTFATEEYVRRGLPSTQVPPTRLPPSAPTPANFAVPPGCRWCSLGRILAGTRMYCEWALGEGPQNTVLWTYYTRFIRNTLQEALDQAAVSVPELSSAISKGMTILANPHTASDVDAILVWLANLSFTAHMGAEGKWTGGQILGAPVDHPTPSTGALTNGYPDRQPANARLLEPSRPVVSDAGASADG